MSLAHLRKEYTRSGLRRSALASDPIVQFRAWLDDAVAAGVLEATAMTLATVDARGRPSARVVLLKGVDEGRFSFFTNYASRKGRELEANPHAALVFHWGELERQVRVTGLTSKLSREEAQEYFDKRPRGSRLGAWSSNQSDPVPNRAALEARFEHFDRQFPGEAIPVPPMWGGYGLKPDTIEFWQGRMNRLHDRFSYTRQEDGNWFLERLSP